MLTFIVMPCFNEALYVEQAIVSLLGPGESSSAGAHLVAVDNGSTDDTLPILEAIRRRHPERVHIVEEPLRGFVPPRRSGVRAVTQLSAGMALTPRDILVVQADADTVYGSGYVAAMEAAARNVEGVILEGATRRPAEFAIAHADYVAAERLVDTALEHLEAADEDDVVVDDKICAYRLSDYLQWGGLFEETDEVGDPIHAETTRMFIRAKLAMGARKLRVNPAGAASSRRRVIDDPRYQFATMGYPRERSWHARVTSQWAPVGVDDFGKSVLSGNEEYAVQLRRAHLLALFRFLPALILTAASEDSELLRQPDVETALAHIPSRSSSELSERPGLAIMDVLRLVDSQPELFQSGM